ncbi:S9 family peptidase [Glaciihabitans arcticus]|uniref:S9 family peptidase n=1 Tax=Glaciihabitans arcticus TaxID=2668039 RepID=A0A4Q9GVI4_9MICO|nr:prolyl oligopeptidase family serine peptidase [Glaciihabitans arcticus]TBN56190.1 S9 family peptidase [Glaciihabitans arcticus]
MTSVDENLWLEDIYGEKPLEWVEAQNVLAAEALDSPELDELADRILEVIDSDDRIPIVSRRGEHLYNFWRDTEHPRGLWRRTTLDSYLTATPSWEILLDVDALGALENTEWVFSGARVLPLTHDLALVSLSPDGGDAVVTREFSLTTRSFVSDGFVVPLAKSRVGWLSRDELFVATDFGEGSMTTSSYPRTLRRWTRGTSLMDAPMVHEVGVDDLSIGASHDFTVGFDRSLVFESLDFYRSRTFLLQDDGLTLVEVPEDADLDLHREWLLVQPRSEWLGYAVGSLLAIDCEAFLAGSREFQVVFAPTSSVSLQGWDWTATRLVLTLLDDVSSRLEILDPADWSSTALEVPPLSAAHVIDTSPDDSDELWVHVSGFLTPAAVLRGELGVSPLAVVKSSPSFFDESRFDVSQHFAISDDGTRVPYFQVAPRNLVLDGSHRTLLSGYGGFQHALTPSYSGTIGRAWLERGGVFVLANIRGGGEYGPAWHTSALRSARPRAYEDFAAIARDLVSRGVTVPSRLACEGRSNGGLLVGNMLVSYPELFGAIICGVPLLDMQRYTHLSAGASWIAEYGDPDVPADWEFMKDWSPYQLLSSSQEYPATFLYAATSDDRVGPVQARKMAARMQRLDIPGVLYYEPTDGGHGGAVDNRASARLFAYMYGFAWGRLG